MNDANLNIRTNRAKKELAMEKLKGVMLYDRQIDLSSLLNLVINKTTSKRKALDIVNFLTGL